MFFKYKILCVIYFLLLNFSHGQLRIICETPLDLKEISALEYDTKRNAFWVIQDAGNSNELIAIDRNGKVLNKIELSNAKNIDWEDLTKDKLGNIYIGDFGNNKKSRNTYQIYMIKENDLDNQKAKAKLIEFRLPKNSKELDFESFFLFKGYFYIFSKANKKTTVYRVPNKAGIHSAEKSAKYEFGSKNNKICSATISDDNKTIVLLNRNKLWKLTNFSEDDFFSGDIEMLNFNHNSQKEGVGYIGKNEVVISDERNDMSGGKLYSLKLEQ